MHPRCCSHGTGWWHIGLILGIIFAATAVLEFSPPLSSSDMESVILSFVYGIHKQGLRIFKEEHTSWWNPKCEESWSLWSWQLLCVMKMTVCNRMCYCCWRVMVVWACHFLYSLGLWMWFVSKRRICSCQGLILQCTVMIAEFHDVGESAVAAAVLWLPGFAICFDVRSLWIWLSPEEPCCGQSLQSNYDIYHDKRSCNWLLVAWSTLSSQCSSSL